jgi:hypothetical protein
MHFTLNSTSIEISQLTYWLFEHSNQTNVLYLELPEMLKQFKTLFFVFLVFEFFSASKCFVVVHYIESDAMHISECKLINVNYGNVITIL